MFQLRGPILGASRAIDFRSSGYVGRSICPSPVLMCGKNVLQFMNVHRGCSSRIGSREGAWRLRSECLSAIIQKWGYLRVLPWSRTLPSSHWCVPLLLTEIDSFMRTSDHAPLKSINGGAVSLGAVILSRQGGELVSGV